VPPSPTTSTSSGAGGTFGEGWRSSRTTPPWRPDGARHGRPSARSRDSFWIVSYVPTPEAGKGRSSDWFRRS
jgi:hypothetical protein